MKTILDLLNSKMTEPKAYGPLNVSWFHYLSLFVTVICIIFLIKHFKKDDMKKIKRTILIIGIIMILLEVYKQVIFAYQAGHYQWYAFPFQFCSTPMYLYIILGLTKSKKIEQYLISFLATYGTFAGIAVMIYPSSVFVQTIGINVQTMVHHGLIAAVGLSLLVTKVTINLKTLIKAMAVFSILVLIAYTMNTLFNLFNDSATFNMFFINYKYGTEIPVLALIEPRVPHFVFLIVYILGFSLMAELVIIITLAVKKYLFKQQLQLSSAFSYR